MTEPVFPPYPGQLFDDLAAVANGGQPAKDVAWELLRREYVLRQPTTMRVELTLLGKFLLDAYQEKTQKENKG